LPKQPAQAIKSGLKKPMGRKGKGVLGREWGMERCSTSRIVAYEGEICTGAADVSGLVNRKGKSNKLLGEELQGGGEFLIGE